MTAPDKALLINWAFLCLPSGEGEYGLEDPVDSLRPTAWAGSAGTGEHEPIFMNPMGLVLERLTTPALQGEQSSHTLCSPGDKPQNPPWGVWAVKGNTAVSRESFPYWQ